MESSNLQKLVQEIAQPLKDNPDALLRKVLGTLNYYKVMGLINSPMVKAFLPKEFNPGALIGGALDKLDELGPEFWTEAEEMILGALSGDPGETARIKKVLGVVVDEN
jgi:hypothetical protein